jgi:diguanylate cyclase (GGDEF)-like protein
MRSSGVTTGHRARVPLPPTVLLAGLAAGILLYLTLPMSDETAGYWYSTIAVGGVVTGYLGLRRHRPDGGRGWTLILLGYAGWVIGDALWSLEQQVFPGHHPVPSDGVYLVAYLTVGAGALTFVRRRRDGGDRGALLEASILTTGAAVVVAVFVLAPIAADSALSPVEKLAASGLPLGDLFLLGVLTRMMTGPGARTASYRLLTASLATFLAADTAWNLGFLSGGGGEVSRWIGATWLLGYLLLGAAAGVPSMRVLEGPATIAGPVLTPSRRRLVALAAGLMLPGVTLIVDGATGGAILWPVIGAGSLALSGLVLLRMTGLLHTVQQQAELLAELAHSDSLTGAPNRRNWDGELARACHLSWEQGTTLSVAILDLDHFKAFNDEHGHQAGDRLLQDAVAAWSEALPEGTMLARYGGEEFALLMPATSPEDAADVVLGLRDVTPGGRTFSAGIAGCAPGTDPAAAVAAADEALYAAKRAGRNRVVVHGATAAPDTIPALTMVTQPIVDTRTFGVTGHEALARFTVDHPGGIQEVFRQAHAAGHGDLLELSAVLAAIDLPGRRAGHDLFVNVTAAALVSPRFMAGLPERLDGVVVELGEDPQHVAAEDVAVALDVLRSRGARVALDDVGAGAQEFARLAALRPDVIKVDRSLVNGCSRDPARTAVLRGLVTFAGHLGLSVCAEGVEDVADLDHLVSLGVSHVQGYLLARPAPGWQEVQAAPVPATP